MRKKYCQCEINVINRDLPSVCSVCETIKVSVVTLITQRKATDSGCLIIKGAADCNSCIAVYGA